MKIRFGGTFAEYFRQYPFVVVDVGARDGIKKEWGPLRRYLRYIAFEPDPDECKKLSGQPRDFQAVFHNAALWSSKTALPLHITKNEGFSSVYVPDADFLDGFSSGNTAGYAVKKKITMQADKLDSVVSPEDKRAIDFIKVDAEGCASEVLRGAENVLAEGTVVGLQVEAEFNPKYKGQPLFHDVDRELRKHHYQLFQAETCCWKRKAGLQTGGSQGQLMHGDLSYFLAPDVFFRKIADKSKAEQTAKAVKYLVFLCLYGVYDLAFEIFHEARKKAIIPDGPGALLEKELSRTKGLVFRVPKLQERGLPQQLVYHAFMLLFGVWLKRFNYWKSGVQLG